MTDDHTPSSPYPDAPNPASPYPDSPNGSTPVAASPYPDANGSGAPAAPAEARPARQARQARQGRRAEPAPRGTVPAAVGSRPAVGAGAGAGWLDQAPAPAPARRRARVVTPVNRDDDVPPWYEDEYFAYDDWGDLPKQSSTFRRVTLFLIGFGAIIALSASFVWRWYEGQIDPEGPLGQEVVLEIPQGATTADTARILADNDVVNTGFLFRWWLGRQDDNIFQAGTFEFNENMSYEEALGVLRAGPVNSVGELAVTIPPGLRVDQVAAAIMESGVPFDPEELDEELRGARKPAVLGTGLIVTSEGFLAPDTYNVADNDTDEQAFVERLVDQFDIIATELELADAEDKVGYSPYQVLTVASMIEKEAGLPPEERGQIARVIYNRLEQGMKLQIDATTVYAWSLQGVTKTRLTERDLEIESPYNTYFVEGLPQGPIGGVSRASLEAALNPPEGDWLFYVRTDENGEFSHFFTASEAEFFEKKALCEEKGFC
jgi:UPF0755 protein